MRTKNYKQKRIDLKEEKREGMKQDFEDMKSRKRFVEGIKRSYRSLKRSERQIIKKKIDEDIDYTYLDDLL
jgi:hypothetical protein